MLKESNTSLFKDVKRLFAYVQKSIILLKNEGSLITLKGV
jgi:hypothetical protein